MRVGAMVTNYNSPDWERLMAGDYARAPLVLDSEIVDNTLVFGALVEPLGYDSIWTAEHYGSPYSMQGDPLQWLSYWAARTDRVDVGTAVLVLPWWDPVRLAHEMALLDLLLGGRRLIPGVGRGVSPHEYASLRIPHEESRERFHEVLEILRLADAGPTFSYEGKHYQIPETMVRPGPRHKGQLLEATRGAFSTPASAELGAKAGIGQMFVAGEPIPEMTRRADEFNRMRRAAGFPPEGTTCMLLTRCLPRCTDDDLEEANRYFVTQLQDVQNHYGRWKNPGFAGVKGYEDYVTRYERDLPVEKMLHRRSPQLIGTPDDILKKIEVIQRAISMDYLIVHINHGGIPLKDAIDSLTLFAKEVLPVVHKMETPLHASTVGTDEPAAATA